MANYTVAAGQVAAHAKLLTVSTVDTVTFQLGSTSSPGWAARLPKKVQVLSDGVADIYFTVDGSTPTVAGSNCYRVPAVAAASVVVSVADSDPADPVVVKLISSGAATYSVSRAG